MFWTIKSTVDRIWLEVDGGWVFDNTRLNRDVIRDKVLTARSALLAKYLRSTLGSIEGQYYNKCCVDFYCEEDCPDSGNKVWKADLPEVISDGTFRSFRFLGSNDLQTSFEHKVSLFPNEESFLPFGNDSKEPYYNIIGNTAYIYNKPRGMTKGVIVAIFADPFSCDCDEDIIFVPSIWLDEIEKQVKISLSGFLIQRKIDKMNNANPDN